MIKTSKHTTRFANTTKKQNLQAFLAEYRRMAATILDHMWHNPVCFNDKVLDISNQKYDCPQFFSTKNLGVPTTLSARALKCCSTQVCSMIRAVLAKHSKRIYMLNKLKLAGKSTSKLEALILKQKITKPSTTNIKAELNSICCDYSKSTNSFDGFIQLRSIGKSFGKIRIPIKNHRHSNKLSTGKLLTSFLISSNSIDFRWELPNRKTRSTGKILGADQGINAVLTFSNNKATPSVDIHGHSLTSIIKKLSRKRKGGKAFLEAQLYRANFINWSINQLNFKNIKQINLENIKNIGYKNKRSRFLSHFTNTLIRDKLYAVSELEGFSIRLQSSTYRSQRCSRCGLVLKANRKARIYDCNCGLRIDADLNAARNHAISLPDIPFSLRNLQLNRNGFFWKQDGFYSLNGEALAVPLS